MHMEKLLEEPDWFVLVNTDSGSKELNDFALLDLERGIFIKWVVDVDHSTFMTREVAKRWERKLGGCIAIPMERHYSLGQVN